MDRITYRELNVFLAGFGTCVLLRWILDGQWLWIVAAVVLAVLLTIAERWQERRVKGRE